MPSTDINPIIPGFSPDPSIVLIDETFFLVTSTFHVFPGLPIYTSKDLISWKHIGNAINRRDQLSLAKSKTRIWPPGVGLDETGEGMVAVGGLYAPTIRQHNGIIYIVCTNVIYEEERSQDTTENFIISTKDIWSNEWSDPVYFEFNGIDPSIFFDDDGRSYMQGSARPGPMTKINCFEIDLKNGKKLSGERTIWEGTGGIYPEGPHLSKKDGWYYLLISEGGTHENHSITVARSIHIWGPYESFDGNPVLTARGTDEYVRSIGHCDIFQDRQGSWWGVCLGIRKETEKNSGGYIMGRESFLTPATWAEGEWPILGQVRLNPVLENGTALVRAEGTPRLTAESMVGYLYIRDAILNNHSFSNNGKTITLTASNADLSQWIEPVTFVGKRQRELEGHAVVTMYGASPPPDAQLKAGLAYYKDEHRYIKLFYDFSTSEIVFELVNNAKNISQTLRETLSLRADGVLSFRIFYQETHIMCLYSYEVNREMKWKLFGSVQIRYMSGPDFVGPIIGVFATSQVPGVQVRFEELEVDKAHEKLPLAGIV